MFVAVVDQRPQKPMPKRVYVRRAVLMGLGIRGEFGEPIGYLAVKWEKDGSMAAAIADTDPTGEDVADE